MIRLERASRWYGQVIGLNDVSCEIGPGLTALLGPNGAGKSTLLRLVTGQLRPTTGSVSVLGEQPFANTRVMAQLGYCPEIDSFYETMSGRQFVTLLGAMSGLSGAKLRERVAQSIERTGMSARCGGKLGGYSKGMRQRIKIAQALVHDPRILILDEPLNGLDPVGRKEVPTLLAALAQEGKCVVVSSHILYEVEQLTHNMLLIHRGRLLAQGDIFQIRALIDGHPHHISITVGGAPEAQGARALAKALLDLPFVLSVRFDEKNAARLEIATGQPEQFYARFPGVVRDGGFEVTSFHSPDNNLEAVFKYLVNT